MNQDYQSVPPPVGSTPRSTDEPARRRSCVLPAAFVIGCLPWVILISMAAAALVGAKSGRVTGDHVALIRVSGVITAGASESGLLGGSVSGSESIVAQLVKARRDRSAKAILIRINSPGGSPAGSEEVWKEIKQIRDSGKPVYVSMGDIAASGGYYIACAADRIYADDSSLTGSIGVIFNTADLSGLYRKIGVNPETVKSGKFKDLGSSDRPLTDEERGIIQGIVDSTFARFVKAVADGRRMPVEDVRKLADGRVFTGTQALEHNLIDEIGGLRDATLAAAKKAGLRGEPKIVEYGKRSLLDTVLGFESERAMRSVEDAARRELLDRLLRPSDDAHNLR